MVGADYKEFERLRIAGRAHAKCVTCGGFAFRTDWEPPEGIHPGMHEYICSRGHKTYITSKVKPQGRRWAEGYVRGER